MRTLVEYSFLLLLIVGCGNQSTVQVSFDPTVPADQQAHIQNDLQALSSINLTPSSPNDLAVIDIPDLSSASLQQWLQARVSWIVGESFGEGNAPGSSPSLSDLGKASHAGLADSGNVVTLMFNLGSLIYLDGKQTGQVESVALDGQSEPVRGPRVGVIEIGQGLFTVSAIPDSDPDSQANSFLRLAVLFHEARHDDGNKDNAAFPHALCTSGDYAGDRACEGNLNGPYAVQATLLNDLFSACTSCNANEEQALLLFLADLRSRLLPGAAMQDDRPEQM